MPRLSMTVLLMFLWVGCGQQETPAVPAPMNPMTQTKSVRPPAPALKEQVPVESPLPPTAPPVIVAAPVVQKIYRDSDTRPVRDDARAEEFGVHKYTSSRLILYTDIEPAIAETLPGVIDQAYAAWVKYFGELPPNREGTPYQMTGYLIDDPQRFVAAGMLPEGPPMFRFGRHIGAEFWMNKMNSDYYRRHLLIHEATHCFMTTMPKQYPPRWYLEGMAEFFGTHVLQPDGTVKFGVMPKHSEDFPGLGRIDLIQQELARNQPASLAQLGAYTTKDWDKPLPIPYAWSWAACKFLDDHPRYRDRFRELGQHMEGSEFQRYMAENFETDRALLAAEWDEFQKRLIYGYDVAANAFVTHAGPLQPLDGQVALELSPTHGWQSTGVRIAAGSPIQIEADGEVVLDQDPQPWKSEPQGISVRYAAGHPIGLLMAAILPDQNERNASSEPFKVFAVGRTATITPEQDGELWLRVNDVGNSLSNNTGGYQIKINAQK